MAAGSEQDSAASGSFCQISRSLWHPPDEQQGAPACCQRPRCQRLQSLQTQAPSLPAPATDGSVRSGARYRVQAMRGTAGDSSREAVTPKAGLAPKAPAGEPEAGAPKAGCACGRYESEQNGGTASATKHEGAHEHSHGWLPGGRGTCAPNMPVLLLAPKGELACASCIHHVRLTKEHGADTPQGCCQEGCAFIDDGAANLSKTTHLRLTEGGGRGRCTERRLSRLALAKACKHACKSDGSPQRHQRITGARS